MAFWPILKCVLQWKRQFDDFHNRKHKLDGDMYSIRAEDARHKFSRLWFWLYLLNEAFPHFHFELTIFHIHSGTPMKIQEQKQRQARQLQRLKWVMMRPRAV